MMRALLPAIERRDGKTILRALFDPDRLAGCAWQPFRTGVQILPLYGGQEGSADTAPAAALLRYEPGASVPLHEHAGYEHVFVLAGSQRDAHGVYERGAFVVNEPGSRHTVISEEGCVVLVIWNRPVAFVRPEDAIATIRPEGAER